VNKPTGTNATTVSYNPGTSLPYGLPVRVKLEFNDDGPAPNVTTYEWSYTVEDEPLFAINDTTLWSYEVNGLELGTTWKDKGYDESAWPKGAALLADETGATVETIRTPFLRGGFVTFYFRTHFTWSGSLAGVSLRLRHVIDDGAICYLNGVEVNRTDNMPTGPVDYLTVALIDHENAWQGPYSISPTNLVVGDNVFAVEVHQNAGSSSDVVFGAELIAVLLAPPNFTSVRLDGGGLSLEWSGTGTLQQAGVVTGPYTNAPSQTNPQTIPATGPAMFYRLKQ
jgi:hypothetical protein